MAIVQITRNGEILTVSHPQINLIPEESVEWNFTGLNAGEIACIHFDHLAFPESEPYGPFQCLEPSSTNVRGLGNTGRPGEYHYTAFVVSNAGVAARSDGNAKIVNLSATVDTSPDATIHYDGTDLHVQPFLLKVDLGNPALWYITGVPAEHFISLHFDHFPDAMVGPFSSLQFSRGLGTARVATASNFGAHHPVSGHESDPVTYHVSLRRPDGTVLVGKDPVIEPPPGWVPGD